MSQAKEDRDRKANPQLERILDELEVAKFNLPVDTPSSVGNKLDAAADAIRSTFDRAVPSKSEREDQAEAEEEAKKPQ